MYHPDIINDIARQRREDFLREVKAHAIARDTARAEAAERKSERRRHRVWTLQRWQPSH
jgi:hypothetical protein